MRIKGGRLAKKRFIEREREEQREKRVGKEAEGRKRPNVYCFQYPGKVSAVTRMEETAGFSSFSPFPLLTHNI